jgi:hypothetical protein
LSLENVAAYATWSGTHTRHHAAREHVPQTFHLGGLIARPEKKLNGYQNAGRPLFRYMRQKSMVLVEGEML